MRLSCLVYISVNMGSGNKIATEEREPYLYCSLSLYFMSMVRSHLLDEKGKARFHQEIKQFLSS